MGTGEIMPEEQEVEEVIIPPSTQREDNSEPEDNDADEDNTQQPEQSLCPAHPRVTNEVLIERMLDSINAPGPLTRSRATQLANFWGHFAFVSITEPTKVDEAFKESEWIQAM